MRPYLVSLALVAGLAAPSQAAAAICYAREDLPTTAGGQVIGTGYFTCSHPMSGMKVTICIEIQPPGEIVWTTVLCNTDAAPAPVGTIKGFVAACVQTTSLARAVVSGSNDAGYTGSATSTPILAPGAGSCGP